jgi:eukaryotic-like serine/threonine-protein kinase
MHPQQPPQGGQPGGHDPIIGQTIGNYVVSQKLGEGGMGSVYLAEHPAIGKKVALKVLHAEFAANQEVVSRFFNEAKAVNDIQHPNIVDIVDYGVLAAGPGGEQMVYFIMEFLPGIALADLIRREAPLAPERALAVSLQVADALSASHAKGIIHRDLKPDNIMLIQRGRERDFVKLLDFGIAKLTGDQPGSRRTRTGIVMGTPAYMSPEQCEGRGNIDHRTDIYALGIVLYEMITGRVPFTGEGYGEVLVQHLTQAPAAPSTIRGLIPPHVEQVVLKALEKRPEMRFPTVEEMMRALADPVGYVEAHGGIAGFNQAMLQPSSAPLQAGTVRLTPTPSPLSPLTPVPGSIAAYGAPAGPGTPTTLGAAAGQVAGTNNKKIGLFVGVGAAVAAIVVAVVLLVGGGTSEGEGAGGAGEGAGAELGGTDPEQLPAVVADAAPQVVVAPPDAAPAVVVPEKVKLTIDSTPKGALVFVGGEKDPRGKTPLSFEMDRSDQEIEIKLFQKRYKWETRTVKLDGNQSLDIALERERTGSTSSGQTSSGKKPGGDKPTEKTTYDDSDETVNPFKRKNR